MKKKKSIGDIISYSEVKKGRLISGIILVSLGMLLSICPILVTVSYTHLEPTRRPG